MALLQSRNSLLLMGAGPAPGIARVERQAPTAIVAIASHEKFHFSACSMPFLSPLRGSLAYAFHPGLAPGALFFAPLRGFTGRRLLRLVQTRHFINPLAFAWSFISRRA